MSSASAPSAFHWPQNIRPPVAARIPKELTSHGDTRIDPYYWLNEKENPETIAYLNAENQYLDNMLGAAKPFREALFEEMKGRIREKDESVPVFKKGFYYYTRSEEGMQYFKYCRKKAHQDAVEEILLDVDDMARGHAYYAVSGFSVSPDQQLLAFGVDVDGRRQFTIFIKDLQTGQVLPDALAATNGHAVWANDNATLFYAANNPVTLLSEKIKKHRLGEDTGSDAMVYEETDKSNYIGVSRTRSGQYLLISSSATLSSEIRILEADLPDEPFRVFQPRIRNVLYHVDHAGATFIIRTNWHATNFRLMETPLQATAQEHWTEVIAHRSDVLLQGAEPFRDHLVLTERTNGLLYLRIRNLLNGEEHYIDFGEQAYTAFSGSNPEFDTTNFRYHYTSLTTPMSTYDYHVVTREKKLMKQQEVEGGYDPLQYTSERVYATAKDGTAIPVSIVYRNDFTKDGTAPLLLYGYGAYGHSMDASFSSSRLSLLDRGFAFAIAHVRGGQEMGRHWYESGKLMHKKNTFTDFINCAELLIRQNYTAAAHLYAMGGSAGGLLAGVVATMRPDLWNGVIAAVPFVDVVTTMLDESIPLTTNEFDEWGNPAEPEAYAYMKSYSPYDTVGSQYPNMLVTTGLNDSQVQYFEPAKWVAAIRAAKAENTVLLFHINMEAGHGGASGRFEHLREVALQYTFLLALESKSYLNRD